MHKQNRRIVHVCHPTLISFKLQRISTIFVGLCKCCLCLCYKCITLITFFLKRSGHNWLSAWLTLFCHSPTGSGQARPRRGKLVHSCSVSRYYVDVKVSDSSLKGCNINLFFDHFSAEQGDFVSFKTIVLLFFIIIPIRPDKSLLLIFHCVSLRDEPNW